MFKQAQIRTYDLTRPFPKKEQSSIPLSPREKLGCGGSRRRISIRFPSFVGNFGVILAKGGGHKKFIILH